MLAVDVPLNCTRQGNVGRRSAKDVVGDVRARDISDLAAEDLKIRTDPFQIQDDRGVYISTIVIFRTVVRDAESSFRLGDEQCKRPITTASA